MIHFTIILQDLGNTLTNFIRDIRIIDLLDIAVISFFLYIVLNWLRESASKRSLISFFLLLAVYIIARLTGMYLTELLIEGFFIIILIGVVVVFQSDMRRIFDRMGNWSFFRSSTPSLSNITTSVIAEAALKMADNYTGALIAIKGKEEWDRHIQGGIELNGQVTIPLLQSIFNTKAPGHDGAVLLEGNKIAKFAVHLPLSTHLYKIAKGGTRHTAALGFAEACDALVVVVSEERGSISIAKDGQLNELSSASELKKKLDDFWEEHYQPSSPSFTSWWKRRSARTAFASVALAIVMWLSFAYQPGTVYRTFSVPIEYRNLQSAHIALQDSVPLKARITLSGPERAFRTLEASELVVSFNLASEDIGDGELEIQAHNINLPAELNLYEASPPTLHLTFKDFDPVELPIKVPTKGKLAEGLQLISIQATPAFIQLLADSTGQQQDSIQTAPVDLSKLETSTTITKELRIDTNSFKIPKESARKVSVKIVTRKENE